MAQVLFSIDFTKGSHIPMIALLVSSREHFVVQAERALVGCCSTGRLLLDACAEGHLAEAIVQHIATASQGNARRQFCGRVGFRTRPNITLRGRIRAIILDRELFPIMGKDRFNAIRLIRARLGARSPVIVLATHDHAMDDWQAALACGVRIVVPARPERDRLWPELKSAIDHDDQQTRYRASAVRRARHSKRWRRVHGLLGGFLGACLALFAAPCSDNLSSNWVVQSRVGETVAGTLPCEVSVYNAGSTAISGLEVRWPKSRRVVLDNLVNGSTLDRLETHRTMRINFTLRILAVDVVKEANSPLVITLSEASNGSIWARIRALLGYPSRSEDVVVPLDAFLTPHQSDPPLVPPRLDRS